MPSAIADKPKVALKVEVPGNGKLLNGAEGDAAAAELGMVRLPNKLLSEMSSLGIDIERAGIVHTDRGFAFGTKEAVWACVQALSGEIGESRGEALCEIAGALSKLAKAMSVLSGKNFMGEDAPKQPDAPRRSFAPGQQVHFHVHHADKTGE